MRRVYRYAYEARSRHTHEPARRKFNKTIRLLIKNHKKRTPLTSVNGVRYKEVRVVGLEPTRLATPDPKSGLSTNFSIPAYRICGRKDTTKIRNFQIFLKNYSLLVVSRGARVFCMIYWRAASMMSSRWFWYADTLSISTLRPGDGSMPDSVLFPSGSVMGHAEKRIDQPLGRTLSKGRPEPPPVRSPQILIILGKRMPSVSGVIVPSRARISCTKLLAALKQWRLVRITTGRIEASHIIRSLAGSM